MTSRCTVCGHPERDTLEQAVVAGASTRDIAGRFRLSRSAVSRHMASHLPVAVIEREAARDTDRADSLRDRLEELYTRAERILDEAEAAGRHNVALAGIKELRGILEFAAKLAGSFGPQARTVIRLTLSDGQPVAFQSRGPDVRALPRSEELDSRPS